MKNINKPLEQTLENEKNIASIENLEKSGIIKLNHGDADYMTVPTLLEYIENNPNISELDMGKHFARSAFETDELINLLKDRGIKIINYSGIGQRFRNAGIDINF